MLQMKPYWKATLLSFFVAVTLPRNSAHAGGTISGIGLHDGGMSYGCAVSADGKTVVGFGETPDGTLRAFRWTRSSIDDLGTLGGDYSEARAVNADGSIVTGFSYLADGETCHAFRWTRDGMEDLGTLGGSNS